MFVSFGATCPGRERLPRITYALLSFRGSWINPGAHFNIDTIAKPWMGFRDLYGFAEIGCFDKVERDYGPFNLRLIHSPTARSPRRVPLDRDHVRSGFAVSRKPT